MNALRLPLSFICIAISALSGCANLNEELALPEVTPMPTMNTSAGSITMLEGFETTGEIDFIEGELIGETVERAGGFKGLIYLRAVVEVFPKRDDPRGIVCLSDQTETRPGDGIRAVRMHIPERTYPCTIVEGDRFTSFQNGFVFAGNYEFVEGLTPAETIERAGGLYSDGFLEHAVWLYRSQYPRAVCLNSNLTVGANVYFNGIEPGEIGANLDCSDPDNLKVVGLRSGFNKEADFPYTVGMKLSDAIELGRGVDENHRDARIVTLTATDNTSLRIVCVSEDPEIFPGEEVRFLNIYHGVKCPYPW